VPSRCFEADAASIPEAAIWSARDRSPFSLAVTSYRKSTQQVQWRLSVYWRGAIRLRLSWIGPNDARVAWSDFEAQTSFTEAKNPDARSVWMNWSTIGPGLAKDHWNTYGAVGSSGLVVPEEIDVKYLKYGKAKSWMR